MSGIFFDWPSLDRRSRNRLVLDFVRIVKELDARAFVFENVKGLTVGKHLSFLNEIIAAFEEANYQVRTSWKVLDAAEYGVPQHRERLILIGTKKGEKLPVYPTPTTTPADAAPVKTINKGPNCKHAIGDLPDADRFHLLSETDEVSARLGNPSPYAAEMRCLTNDAWHYSYIRKWDPTKLTSSARTAHSDISQRRFSETEQGSVEPISRFFKLSAKGLSNTLRAGTDGARGAFTSPRPIHYKYPRCVTVREMARLHGFPDWFRFHVTKWHGARQIGNAVPPPLARAVAAEMLRALGHKPERPSRELEMGEISLLSVVMTEASKHFNVKKPNTRRDMKSGAKKRKQHETEAARLGLMGASIE